eukprot:NODE_177_length_14091_cov_0.996141.p7 type:complete len:229 gc:universal NODE_177_length_14091_cov_0.996141:5129-5815(+)
MLTEHHFFHISFGFALFLSICSLSINGISIKKHGTTNSNKCLVILDLLMILTCLVAQFKDRTIFHEIALTFYITGLNLYPFLRNYHLLSPKLKQTGFSAFFITLVSFSILAGADYGYFTPMVGLTAIVCGFMFPFMFNGWLLISVEPMTDAIAEMDSILSQSLAQVSWICSFIVFLLTLIVTLAPKLHILNDAPCGLLPMCAIFFALSDYYKLKSIAEIKDEQRQLLE